MIKLKQLIENTAKMTQLEKSAEELFHLWKNMPEGERKEKLKNRIDAIGRKIDRVRDADPYEGDKHAFLKHHYTGHISSNAYQRYGKEGGLSWVGEKSRYTNLIHSGKYGKFDVEFRTEPHDNEKIVAFVDDKPVGLASNEFGAVGVWVEGPYQQVGIGLELMDLHIQQRPTFKSKVGKIGQMTYNGISLTKKYYDRMVKRHGLGWFKKMPIKEDHDYDAAWDYSVDQRPLKSVKRLVDFILKDTVHLQKALGFKNVSVAYIINDGKGGLARYIAGTMDTPYIVISTRVLAAAAKRYGVNLGTAVETTVVHEFGHAYLEMCGIDTNDHDEEVVEQFAREFDDSRNVKNAMAILDSFVREYD